MFSAARTLLGDYSDGEAGWVPAPATPVSSDQLIEVEDGEQDGEDDDEDETAHQNDQ